MKNISIWEDSTKGKNYLPLKKDTQVDVLIVGGGITGISSLYHLDKMKFKTILVEKNEIGKGVTSKSTGKLTFLQNDLIDKIRTNFNSNDTYKYIMSQKDAIKNIVEVINKEKINCDLEKCNSFIYTNKEDEVVPLKNLKDYLSNNYIKTFEEKNSLVDSLYSFSVSDTYIFNPYKFVVNLADKIKSSIYENTTISKIEKVDDFYHSYTKDGALIKSKYIILACHYPFFNIPFLFPIKSSIEKSYICAIKKELDNTSLISYSYPFISIRSYKKYMLYLSNTHPLYKLNIQNNFKELLDKVSLYKAKTEYIWSNSDVVTNDGLPYIGRIKDNLFIATGYNTWGLTNGFLAGTILTKMINNEYCEYENLFNPKRVNESMITGVFNSSIKSMQGYIKGISNGKHKCTHMCAKLVYNSVEKTWDCPCHGSRFNSNGKVICGPANDNIIL